MYRFQAFCLLVLTFLVFSQGTPENVDSRAILRAAKDDVEVLRNNIKVLQATRHFRIPTDVPSNCSINALACYGPMLTKLGRNQAETVINTINNVIINIEQFTKTKSSNTFTTKELCFSMQCTFNMVMKKTDDVLKDLRNLLMSMNSEQ